MQNKKTYTDFIISELNKGNVKYNDVCLLFCTKFDLTKQSFNKYWLIANEDYKQQREAINNAKLEESIAQEKEAVKSLVLNKVERMRIAEEIAIGKAKKIQGTIVMPSPSDRLRALDYLSKIEGDYAPNKLDISTENPIPIFNQNPLNE